MQTMRAALRSTAGHLVWSMDVLRQFSTIMRYRLPLLKLQMLAERRSSDTLFIMGSGASVCEYSAEQWAVIESADSIGLNNWILHEYVPTFYIGELIADRVWLETYTHNLAARRSDYRRTLIILKWRPRMIEKLRYVPYYEPNVVVALTATIPAGGEERVLRWNLRLLDACGLLRTSSILFERTGSLSGAVLLGYKLGYRRIVLCGVDLNTTAYFYDQRGPELERRGLVMPPNRQDGPIHKTLDPSCCVGGIPIDRVIMAIKEIVLEPRNIELYVGAKTSALYPRLPIYPW